MHDLKLTLNYVTSEVSYIFKISCTHVFFFFCERKGANPQHCHSRMSKEKKYISISVSYFETVNVNIGKNLSLMFFLQATF